MILPDYEAEQELHTFLLPGERLLWTGRPRKGLVLRSSDIFMIPFSLLWAGFAFFWEGSVFATDGPVFFRLWGIPFMLIGLYITVGRFIVDAWRRSRTVYGITPERIVILSGLRSRRASSLHIRTLSDISLSERRDGSGSIQLGPADPRYAYFQGMDWPGVRQPPRLELIPEVRRVYEQIVELQRGK